MITISEALAEVKTLGKRLATNAEFIAAHIARDERVRDPLANDGGSPHVLASRAQANTDLRERLIAIRRAIARANATVTVTIEGQTRTIGDWLTWRREVVPGLKAELEARQRKVQDVRRQTQSAGRQVARDATAPAPGDVIVHVNEVALAEELDRLERTLGTLDGQLSVKNATTALEL